MLIGLACALVALLAWRLADPGHSPSGSSHPAKQLPSAANLLTPGISAAGHIEPNNSSFLYYTTLVSHAPINLTITYPIAVNGLGDTGASVELAGLYDTAAAIDYLRRPEGAAPPSRLRMVQAASVVSLLVRVRVDCRKKAPLDTTIRLRMVGYVGASVVAIAAGDNVSFNSLATAVCGNTIR
jgi:hypothetical protein